MGSLEGGKGRADFLFEKGENLSSPSVGEGYVKKKLEGVKKKGSAHFRGKKEAVVLLSSQIHLLLP